MEFNQDTATDVNHQTFCFRASEKLKLFEKRKPASGAVAILFRKANFHFWKLGNFWRLLSCLCWSSTFESYVFAFFHLGKLQCDHFENFVWQILLQLQQNYLVTFCAILKAITFKVKLLYTFLGSLWKNWATFNSYI